VTLKNKKYTQTLNWTRVLWRVYQTLGKTYSENIWQRVICWILFFGHSAKILPSVEKHSAKKSTRQSKNHKKPKKTVKTFFKLWKQLSKHYSLYHTHSLTFFTIILNQSNQIYMFCEWWDSNSRPLSHTYSTLPLPYYINCVYITFSFLMY
jgi:hypothetical protein